MTARVIGLGARGAGDDSVGLVILDELRALAPADGELELVQVTEPSAVIPLLATSMPVVIVDAVVVDGRAPGMIIALDAGSVPNDVRAVSTHGLGLAQALAIARLLATSGGLAPSIRIVGVTIDAAIEPGLGLSAPVEAAVPRAVASVLRTVADARELIGGRV